MDHLMDHVDLHGATKESYWREEVGPLVVERITRGMGLGALPPSENGSPVVTGADVRRAVGILETNAYEIWGNGRAGFRGLFPLVTVWSLPPLGKDNPSDSQVSK